MRGRALCHLLLLAAVLLAGCSSRVPAASRNAAANAPRAAAAAESPSTLVWSVWGSQWELAIDRRVARLFEAEHPGVRIDIVHVEWDGYFDWLEGEWAAGRSPDVMFLNYIPMRAPGGLLESLDPYIKRDGFALGDFYPALLEQFAWQGHYYGLPRDNDTKVIYYNLDAFDAAGLPYPTADWTWTDLRRTAIALTRRTPLRYGFGFEKDHWWRIWLWQNGADIVDNPYYPTRVTLDSPAAAEALDFLAGLINRDRVTPPVEQLTTEGLVELFASGRLAMAFGNHGNVPSFVENGQLRWDVAPLPRGRQAANMAGGGGYTISRLSQNKELAWEFVKYLSGLKAQAIFAESGVITPARRSVREDNIFLRQQPYATGVFLQATESGRPNLMFAGADRVSAALDRALEPVWRGERRAADVLAEIAPEIERYLPPS